MGMINTIQVRFPVIALLIAGASLLALAGCGNGKSATSAPFGSTITVAADGPPVFSADTSTFAKDTATKIQNYRVTVLDEAGQPLDGVRVDLRGSFTNGQNIIFGVMVGSAPRTLSATEFTVNGILNFSITTLYYAQGIQLKPPSNQNAVGSSTGGQLADGTYFYTVTALDFAGETTATAPISAVVTNVTPTTATGSVLLTWNAVAGARGYTIYSGPTASVGAIVILDCSTTPCPNPSLTDTGIYTPGAAPPTTNTTGLGFNNIKGTMQATSGSAIDTQVIDF